MNSVPLEALTSYSNYRKERYALQRTVILLMLLLFLLLPLLFFAAHIRVTLTNPDSGENPIYAISVGTKIPIRQIEARLDGQTVPLYEIAPGSYTAVPRSNGELSIRVSLLNRQITTASIHVLGADTAAPELLSTELGADCVMLYVSDADSGVDFAGISVTAEDGQLIAPVHGDPQTGCVTLPYPRQPLQIRIPDLRGNVLEISLKPQQ